METNSTQTSTNNDLQLLLAELRKTIAKPSEVGLHGNLTVGISYGLLSSIVTNRKENQVSATFRTSMSAGSGFKFKTATKTMDIESSIIFVNELQKLVANVGSVLEIRIGLSFEEIQTLVEDMYDGIDGIPMSYATFEVSLMGDLEGRKRIQKDAEGNEEEVFFLRAGTVKIISKPTPANNPLSDDSALATETELKAGLVKAAQKSRTGFNSWRDAQNGVTLPTEVTVPDTLSTITA
jgi:hypothetical protein